MSYVLTSEVAADHVRTAIDQLDEAEGALQRAIADLAPDGDPFASLLAEYTPEQARYAAAKKRIRAIRFSLFRALPDPD